jgi:uncharacterized damage-inducible protein DinB
MTVDMSKWLSRRFSYAPAPGEFPMIVERLRGAPARVLEKVASIPPGLLTRRIGEAWSIQENVGHLCDLEPLWDTRLTELLEGEQLLRAADMTNQATYDANHNARSVVELSDAFRRLRSGFVARLDSMGNDDIVRTALHPRLQQPMRTIDLCLFVAEHDDHHLAMITHLWRTLERA